MNPDEELIRDLENTQNIDWNINLRVIDGEIILAFDSERQRLEIPLTANVARHIATHLMGAAMHFHEANR